MKCLNCGVELPSGISMCYNCGAKPTADFEATSSQICPRCGTRVDQGTFCTECGFQLCVPASGVSVPPHSDGAATPETVFCTNCGTRLYVADTRTTDKVSCTACGTVMTLRKSLLTTFSTSSVGASSVDVPSVSPSDNEWFSVPGDL